MNINKVKQITTGWDSYWEGAKNSNAFAADTLHEEKLSQCWDRFFNKMFQNVQKPTVLDVASGNGAVVSSAMKQSSMLGLTSMSLNSIDVSERAIESIENRFSNVNATIADACHLPFNDRSIDIVVSQFGIEYAGEKAFIEASRVLSDNGRLMLFSHMEGSGIYQQCTRQLDVIQQFDDTKILSLAQKVFEIGFAITSGAASAEEFHQADARLAPAVEEAKVILSKCKSESIGASLGKIFQDIAYMYPQIENYDPEQVLNWFKNITRGIQAFRYRMEAMLNAALDESQIARIKALLINEGLVEVITTEFDELSNDNNDQQLHVGTIFSFARSG